MNNPLHASKLAIAVKAHEDGVNHQLQGRYSEAASCYQRALESFPLTESMNNLALIRHDSGDLVAAERIFRQALLQNPEYAEAHNNLGNLLRDQSRMEEAFASYQLALQFKPDYVEAHLNLGHLLQDLSQVAEAEKSYRAALTLRPDLVEAINALCNMLERTNQLDKLRECLLAVTDEQCKASPGIAVVKARLLRRDKKLKEALALLQRVQPAADTKENPIGRMELLAVQGDLNDLLGDYNAAFNCFKRSKAIESDLAALRGAKRQDSLSLLLEDHACFSADRATAWTAPDYKPCRIAFLVGFPRSGTTLLDSILRSHPDIDVIEEKPMLPTVLTEVNRKLLTDPNYVDCLDDEQFATLRQIYFDELNLHRDLSRPDSLVIDKFPLNIVNAGLIHRLFPEARFILALRDPRDCVLSCFMQNFKPNDAMANFLTLEDDADYYHLVMRRWQQYESALTLDAHRVRYEDIVADFSGSVRQLLEFLELPWDEAVTRFQETALNRQIRTPSYHQVVQPIYQRANGRWRNYKEQMAHTLPLLQQWVELFGYADSIQEAGAPETAAIEAYKNGINQQRQGLLTEAESSFRQALTIIPAFPEPLNDLGVIAYNRKDLKLAEFCFRTVLFLRADAVTAYNNLGILLRDQLRLPEAESCYRTALQLKPDFVEGYINLGNLLLDQYRHDEAEKNYRTALKLRPDATEALAPLCSILERANRLGELSACLAGVSDARCRTTAVLALVKAKLLWREMNYLGALELIKSISTTAHEPSKLILELLTLQGDLNDRLGEPALAYDCFVRRNQLASQSPGWRGVDKSRVWRQLQMEAGCFTAGRAAAWTNPEYTPCKIAFLVGIPRSGTTLLDSILRSHPDIDVIEEKPMLSPVSEEVSRKQTTDPNFLDCLDEEQFAALRQIYFNELNLYRDLSRPNALVIDKFPLNSARAGLIHRLFPEAKFILALRDPRDCVLSCFMQNFKPNDAMANFLTLEDGAKFYHQVMQLWSQYESDLQLNVQRVRYEDIVADLSGTVRPLLEFLELPWDEAVTRFQETALNRAQIETPSYHQVVQPIYQRASGRWRNYAEQMAHVLPLLQPWVERWGYDDEPAIRGSGK